MRRAICPPARRLISSPPTMTTADCCSSSPQQSSLPAAVRMTDRRRNLLILLLVAGLLVASLAVIATKPTRQGLDLKGGVSLVYEAKPTRFSAVTSDSINRTIDIMRERVDTLGVAEPEIRARARTRSTSRCRAQRHRRGHRAGRHDGPDVLLRLGEERPRARTASRSDRPAGHRRQRGRPRRCGLAPVLRCGHPGVALPEPTPKLNVSHEGLFYGVDDKAKKVVCGPQATEKDLRETCANQRKKFDRAIKVPGGTVVVQAEEDETNEQSKLLNDDAYYVLATTSRCAARTSRTPSRTSTAGPAAPARRTSRSSSPKQGRKIWQDDDARDRPARPAVLPPGLQPAASPPSTSRSSSTTSSSRSRTSTSSRTRTASTAATARRSRAASRSSRPSAWRTC